MTQHLSYPALGPDTTKQLMTMLELHRSELPFADEELTRHRALRRALDDQIARSEQALADWRQALSQRWEAEINGQRVYIAIQRKMADYFGNDAIYLQLIAPSQPAAALTASNLLADMRRIEASLALLRPRPPFAEESLAQMRAAVAQLAGAIERSEHCEAQRRQIMIEQRLAAHLYERLCQKTRQRMAAHAPGELVATS